MAEELEGFVEWKVVDLIERVVLERVRVILVLLECVVSSVSCLEAVEVGPLQAVEESPEDQSLWLTQLTLPCLRLERRERWIENLKEVIEVTQFHFSAEWPHLAGSNSYTIPLGIPAPL